MEIMTSKQGEESTKILKDEMTLGIIIIIPGE